METLEKQNNKTNELFLTMNRLYIFTSTLPCLTLPLTILHWCCASMLLEYADKVIDVEIANLKPDLTDRFAGGDKQLLRLVNPMKHNIVLQIVTGYLLENPA